MTTPEMKLVNMDHKPDALSQRELDWFVDTEAPEDQAVIDALKQAGMTDRMARDIVADDNIARHLVDSLGALYESTKGLGKLGKAALFAIVLLTAGGVAGVIGGQQYERAISSVPHTIKPAAAKNLEGKFGLICGEEACATIRDVTRNSAGEMILINDEGYRYNCGPGSYQGAKEMKRGDAKAIECSLESAR